MKRLLITMILMATLVSSVGLQAQEQDFDYDSYQPSSLPNIINDQKDTFFPNDQVVDHTIDANPSKYIINCIFTKDLREINPNKIEFIQIWGKTLGHPEFANLYKYEFQVRQGGKDYWIPIQDPLLPYMGNELKIGQQFDLYIILAGTVKDEWVFLATEFSTK